MAFVAAAPAALGLWLATLYVHEHVTVGAMMAAGRVPYMIIGGVLVGVPIVIGLVVRQVVAVTWAQPELSFLPVPVVLVTGAGAGWVWWRVWSGAMGVGTPCSHS